MQDRKPHSDHDWAIHAINIHGIFFERWCRGIVDASDKWRLQETNYPVAVRGKESALDIWAVFRSKGQQLSLLIECKKNNPDFVDWNFIAKDPKTEPHVIHIHNDEIASPGARWTPRAVFAPLRSMRFVRTVADDGRETKGSYTSNPKAKDSEKTKTSNDAIAKAANQVALATQAIVEEQMKHLAYLRHSQQPPWARQAFLPVIVTSARVFSCEVKATDVDPKTGEVPFDKVKRAETPILFYEYPLPRHLQNEPADLVAALTDDSLRHFAQMNILLVQSEHFPDLLRQIGEDFERFSW